VSGTIPPQSSTETSLRIAVIFGGDSMERDVSVASARQVVAALRERGHEVLAIDMHRGLLAPADERKILAGEIEKAPPTAAKNTQLPAPLVNGDWRDVDLAFLALHGGAGENGTIQSVLDLAGIAYTGSGRLGSALAWDKAISKQLFRFAGVPTPDWLLAPVPIEQVTAELGYPVIVKPTGQGSTVGLSLVRNSEELPAAIELASGFDSDVMIERFVSGRELTVGILQDQPLAVGEIIPARGEIFDYEAKYQVGGAQEIFPAAISNEIAGRVQALGLTVHRALKLDDYSRVDFRMDASGALWCLEVNTLPGLSAGSLLPRSAAAAGIDFPELCERICRAAQARY
jgi:D-alanine-D-alanine ligase